MALDADFEGFSSEDDGKVTASDVGGDRDGDVDVLDCLGPFVRELGLFVGFFGFGFGVFFFALFGGWGCGHRCLYWGLLIKIACD